MDIRHMSSYYVFQPRTMFIFLRSVPGLNVDRLFHQVKEPQQ